MSTRRSLVKTAPSALRQLFVLCLPLLGFSAYAGCSSDAGTSDFSPDAAGQSTSSGGALGLGGFSLTGGSTTTGVGGAGAPKPCTGANCGAAGGAVGTKAPDAPCKSPSECASGRCEPVTGTDKVVCLGACFADAAPCTRALDCCSTGCFSGKCGGMCTVEGEACAKNSECCSNICQGGRCQIDLANPDCRPTGEDCTSGSSRGCCNECDKQTKRCGFGKDTCRAQGNACTADGDCCRGVCDAGTCRTPCTASGAGCTADADCCSEACGADGTCEPPGGGAGGAPGASACTPTGEACTADGECCTKFCFGGFCETLTVVK